MGRVSAVDSVNPINAIIRYEQVTKGGNTYVDYTTVTIMCIEQVTLLTLCSVLLKLE